MISLQLRLVPVLWIISSGYWSQEKTLRPVLEHLFARPLAIVGLLENVFSALVEFAGRRIETNANLLACFVACLPDRVQ